MSRNRNKGETTINIKILMIFCTILLAGSIFQIAPLQAKDYTQNVKAAFIYNFTRYINWINQDSSATFDIAVVGESEIISLLQQIAQQRQVNQKNIQIKHFRDPRQIKDCHILFIPESEKIQLTDILDKISGKNILTVSESEGALAEGIMINFLIAEETIKFEINLQAMKESNFQPSSQLLKVAVRVIE